MTFEEVLGQVRELLQSKQRVSYRALKRQFALDDDYLEDLKAELIKAERVAADEDGDVLVWTGGATKGETATPPASSDPGPQTRDARPTEGERRQLTVEFIDLVGSTTLSQQLDPEDYHARVVAYQAACHQVIARYEGHIAQYLGDGVLVYFGYPAAHEEDAVRAVRSGLEIVAAVGDLKFTLPLQVRIGIHTGPVVVGEIGAGDRTERLALGETPNIAARVQGHAAPNEVLVSPTTFRLLHGLFATEGRGPQELKGISTPMTLYRVVGESTVQSRFEAAVQTGLTPLVGRAEELALLQRRWDQAKAGAGHVVLLSGEPGIGKSRLVQELKEHVITEGARRIEFRCSPYHQNSAFYPIIDHLQRLLHFAREDSPEAKLKKLEDARVGTYGHTPLQSDAVPLLAALLSLPHPDGYPPITVSPQKQKVRTQAALVAWLVEEAEQAAVFCTWEDLHWADPSTLEVLTLLLDQVPTTRLLMLLTFRPEFTPLWGNRSHFSQLTLSRLDRPHVETMVEQVTRGKALPSEVLQQIVSKTDGIPLFVEELTKTVVESGLLRAEGDRYVGAHGGASIPPLAIPSTLQDSLMARLDRLAPVKEIAQLGATIGREFSYELLHAVSPVDEGTLQQGLRQLVEVELLYQRGVLQHATYLFKHALIQDTAYQSLLKSIRQKYHRQIAQVLEERFPDTPETQPELLARHYTEAGLVGQAVPYWQRAGQRTLEHSANVEAIRHLTKGLELLQLLPATPERAQQELTFQITLGSALAVNKGYAAPEVERAYTRARELCQQLGETPQLFPVLWGLWNFYLVRAELQAARELGEQLLSLAQRVQDPVLLLEAHDALGQTFFCLGEFALARAHLEQGIALYDPQQHRSLAFLYGGEDPGVLCLCYAGRVLWALGYADQALRRIHEALTLAQELSHPHSLAIALDWAAGLHQHCREVQAVQERAEAVIALATEQGFPHWVAGGTALRGWALAEQGQEEEGSAQVRWGLAAWQDTGAEAFRPTHLALLAEAYGKAGQAEKGLAALADAPALVEKTEERWYEAELYRLKGQLTLQKLSVISCQLSVTDPRPLIPDPQGEAEACFLKAVEVARKQQAKSWELRAMMSLAKLWQRQGKQKEAHQMLFEVYGWFTEGFDTKDLQEAKTLLDELS
jgi:predicted ATPase/class 3 adenylate cyclase